MSIRDVQTKNALDLITESFFVNGSSPQLDDVLRYMSYYFSQNPVGNPIPLDANTLLSSQESDPEIVNELMAKTLVNLDTLYETCAGQIEDMMLFNSILTTQLERLRIKRNLLDAKVDDYLLGLYDVDGYLYSFSDNFNSIENMNVALSSAYVDTTSGVLALPPNSDKFSEMHQSKLGAPNIVVTDSENEKLNYEVKSPFKKCLDGLTNTAWFFTADTYNPGPVTVAMKFNITKSLGAKRISKIDLSPYGSTPVRVAISAMYNITPAKQRERPFSNSIKTSADKMTFHCDQDNVDVAAITIFMVKTKPDTVSTRNDRKVYSYIFGFKEIVMAEQIYDTVGTYISNAISMPEAMSDNSAIDAVSLVAETTTPPGCDVRFYIAPDVSDSDSIDDFSWRSIKPLAQDTADQTDTIIHFNGLTTSKLVIRSEPQNDDEIELIDLDNTNPDYAKRNPTNVIIADTDVYRIAPFDYPYVADSLKLEEGINTTRIRYTSIDTADGLTFAFWRDKIDTPNSYSTTYGTIDSGHDFFYGGDVGESGKSVYIESYLYVTDEFPIILKDLTKADSNSKTWDVAVFLNGKKIASLPSGKMSIVVPWKFQKGKNHIAVLVNIPAASSANPNPYVGSLKLMDDTELTDFGSVSLNRLKYVDPFKFINNVSATQDTFTIYDGEIVTTEMPTDNYRITFKQKTETGPSAVRVRIDLSRSSQFDRFTPTVDFYRLRFA